MFPEGVAKFRALFAAWIADEQNGLSGSAMETFGDLIAQLDEKEVRLATYDKRLQQIAQREQKLKNPIELGDDTEQFFDESKVPVEVIQVPNPEVEGLDP